MIHCKCSNAFLTRCRVQGGRVKRSESQKSIDQEGKSWPIDGYNISPNTQIGLIVGQSARSTQDVMMHEAQFVQTIQLVPMALRTGDPWSSRGTIRDRGQCIVRARELTPDAVATRRSILATLCLVSVGEASKCKVRGVLRERTLTRRCLHWMHPRRDLLWVFLGGMRIHDSSEQCEHNMSKH